MYLLQLLSSRLQGHKYTSRLMKMQRPSLANTLFLALVHIQATAGYSLPQHATSPLLRALAIDDTRDGFIYGASVGGGPFYPAGVLGLAKDAVDVAAEGLESAAELALTTADEVAAAAGSKKVG